MLLNEMTGNHVVDHIKVRIVRKFNPRVVNVRGEEKTVTDMIIKDEAGTEGKLTLWGEGAADPYDEKIIIDLTDCWCKIYNDQRQLSLGKKGKLGILADDDSFPN